MDKFVLITNAFKDKELVITNGIISYIKEKGGSAKYLLSNIRGDDEDDFLLSDIPSDTECILVLGGDGTLIRIATKVESLEIPLIGVNLGTLGYLCELETSSVYKAIDELMEGRYVIEERMMLSGNRPNIAGMRVAMNDIVLHISDNLSVISINVYVNGKFLSTYIGDGMIIATPTGSTGYNMSAGGPIVDPGGRVLLLTPINAHNLNSKSIVLSDNDVIELEIGRRRAEMDETAAVSFDGDFYCKLAVGDRFIVSKAECTTKICKISSMSFLELLRRKMDFYK